MPPEPSTDEPRRAEWGWTPGQRRVLAVLLLALTPVLAIRYACNRDYVTDPPPPVGPRTHEVADKLDPNEADLATLSALPMIGEKRAQDIIDFRESRRALSPGQVAFRKPEDLLLIRGFGQASVETLRPYLMFPDSLMPATTRTSRD